MAEEDGQIKGHIMLSKTYIKEADENTEILLLAPLSVRLEERNKDISGALINVALACARKMGFRAVFLLGHKNYYSKFGFVPVRNYNIKCSLDIAPEIIDNVIILPLFEGGLEGVSGVVEV